MPVHLYGQVADMDAILALARRLRPVVVEDACQAHGAEYRFGRHGTWRRAGPFGKAAAFSFYPGKNLGACGEAGAVTTDDDQVATTIRMLRDHGQAKKYYHDLEGYNGRLDAIQAGFLRVKLRHLENWTRQRREAAARYDEFLIGHSRRRDYLFEPALSRAIYHLYVIRPSTAMSLAEHLKSKGYLHRPALSAASPSAALLRGRGDTRKGHSPRHRASRE